MIQFFQNIWAWISSHADVIAGVLTPANLILIVTTFVQLRRQRRVISANTGSSAELNASLKENKELRTTAEKLKSQVESLREYSEGLKDDLTQCLTKLNCVLEVQQQAYSVSLSKTATLDAINSIIANGKYADTSSRKAIVEEVAEMREQLEKLTAATKAKEEKVKRITGVAETATESKGVRYD